MKCKLKPKFILKLKYHGQPTHTHTHTHTRTSYCGFNLAFLCVGI